MYTFCSHWGRPVFRLVSLVSYDKGAPTRDLVTVLAVDDEKGGGFIFDEIRNFGGSVAEQRLDLVSGAIADGAPSKKLRW